MITKIKSKIEIHPLYYVVMFICFITGYFKAFSLYTLILIIHELGHVVAAIILKWPILKVTIYPFGCMTTFNQKLNSSIIEEFLILLYGPLFQILFYQIYPLPYHYFILFFNLLPIYPLDGAKILFLIFNNIMSYYYSYVTIYIISFLTIIVLLISDINLLNYIVLFYILYDVIRYALKTNMVMLKFYYERYYYPYKYKKNKLIKGYHLKKMSKVKNNYFFIHNHYYSEKEILKFFLT